MTMSRSKHKACDSCINDEQESEGKFLAFSRMNLVFGMK